MTWTPLPQLTHPPIEWLGFAYYSPLLTGTKVCTEYPGAQGNKPYVDGPVLRTEAAGGTPALEVMFDLDLILHGYKGRNEDGAKELSQRATKLGSGLRNVTVMCPLTEDGPPLAWTIHDAWVSSEPTRQVDPIVNLPRFRSMVTWRVVGRAL